MFKQELENRQQELHADLAVREALDWQRAELPRDKETGLLHSRFEEKREKLSKEIKKLTEKTAVNVGP
jgi:hypothetical protein